jgi:alpha-beta hydrolase superfamily lysophospholipase
MSESSPIGLVKLILLVVGIGYLLLMLFALLFADRFIFPAPPPGYRDSQALLKLTVTETGDTVTMQFRQVPGSRFLVLYHHGNGEDLQAIQPRVNALQAMGFSVLAWDYPGYGTSTGRPTTRNVLATADAIWQQIPDSFGFPHDRVILYGRSVGSGPATWLATRYESAGLILEGAFTSVFRTGLGINILPWDLFNNLSYIDEVGSPVLLLHGTDDRTIPFRHGQQLLEKAREPKFFAWFDGGGHNELVESYAEIYRSSILRFKAFLEEPN